MLSKRDRKGPGGRPAYAPPDGQEMVVRALIANGVQHATIAQYLKIDVKTLKRHHKLELDTGHEMIEARLGLSVVQQALAGNPEMLKFWLRTRGGPNWKVSQQIELTGPRGEPLQPPTLIIGFLANKETSKDVIA